MAALGRGGGRGGGGGRVPVYSAANETQRSQISLTSLLIQRLSAVLSARCRRGRGTGATDRLVTLGKWAEAPAGPAGPFSPRSLVLVCGGTRPIQLNYPHSPCFEPWPRLSERANCGQRRAHVGSLRQQLLISAARMCLG